MGAKTTRHKGDGMSVRQRSRSRILEMIHAGAESIPHAHGNGRLTYQTSPFSTNDEDARLAHAAKVAEEERLAAEAKAEETAAKVAAKGGTKSAVVPASTEGDTGLGALFGGSV